MQWKSYCMAEVVDHVVFGPSSMALTNVRTTLMLPLLCKTPRLPRNLQRCHEGSFKGDVGSPDEIVAAL